MSLLSKIVKLGKSILPLQPSALLDMTPAPPLSLFNVKNHDNESQFQDMNAWHIVTDVDINGTSHASFTVHDNGSDSDIKRFARFQGELSKRVQGNNEPVLSGFAATQRELFDPIIELSDYSYVDVNMRSDGRPYVLSLRLESMNPRERYQGVLSSPPGEWTIQRLKLQRLLLTYNGRENTTQRMIDGYEKLMSVGIFTADGVDGPFCLDIADISLVASE